MPRYFKHILRDVDLQPDKVQRVLLLQTGEGRFTSTEVTQHDWAPIPSIAREYDEGNLPSAYEAGMLYSLKICHLQI